MAYSKVILNGTTLMDVTQKTVTASTLLQGETALKNDGTDVTGTYVPPTCVLQSKTVSPSTSQQTVSPDSGYDGLSSVTVNAMPSGTEGTPSATKGAVSNHAISVTPSVTNTAGYITGGTKTGTAVTVSASELVSGTLPITENGTGIDVTNYASVDVDVSGGGGGSSITVGFVTGDGAEHIHYIDANGTFHTVGPDILDPNQGIIGWTDTVLEGTMIAVSSTMTSMLSNLTNMTLVDTLTISGTRPNPKYISFYYAHS